MKAVWICLVFVLFQNGILMAQDGCLEKIREYHKLLELAPRDSFLNYAIATLKRRHNIDLKAEEIPFPLVPIVTDDPARRTDLFFLAAGITALHESLQLNQLLSPSRRPQTDFVPIKNLGAPDLPSMDFKAQLEKEGLEPLAAEEADFFPHDWLYLRFANGEELINFLMEAELWHSHFLNAYGHGVRKDFAPWRLFKRLGLPDPKAFGALYKQIAQPLAVGVSDLFFNEGTDFTLLLPKGAPALLFKESKNRKIFETRGRVLVSTSRAAMDKVRQVANGATPSLSSQHDFLYLRGVLPAHGNESAFIHLSETFLQNLVGPRLRVLESRRVRCASNMRTHANACQLFLREEGRRPRDLEELKEMDYILEPDLYCPHGGEYALEEGKSSVCSAHNRLSKLRPLIEMELSEVSRAEASAYRRFSRAYTNYWRRYFDPVGLSISRNNKSWDLDFVALPLAQNSLYRNLASITGGAPLKNKTTLKAPNTVFYFTSKIDKWYFKEIGDFFKQWEMARDDETVEALKGAFKRHFSLGLIDDNMLFDFDLTRFLGETLEWNLTEYAVMAPVIAGINLPTYGVLEIRDPEKAKTFLDGLARGVLIRGRRPEGGAYSLKTESYELSGPIQAITCEIFAFKFRIFYAIKDNYLILSTQPGVVKTLFNEAHTAPLGNPINIQLSIFPNRWDKISSSMLLSYEEKARKNCQRFLIEKMPFEDIKNLLGFTLRCPDGGDHTEKGCSVHGRWDAPRQPMAPLEQSAAFKLLNGLEEVSFSFRFIDQGIRSKIQIKRKD